MAGEASAAVLIAAFIAAAGCCAFLVLRLYRARSPAGPRRSGDDA